MRDLVPIIIINIPSRQCSDRLGVVCEHSLANGGLDGAAVSHNGPTWLSAVALSIPWFLCARHCEHAGRMWLGYLCKCAKPSQHGLPSHRSWGAGVQPRKQTPSIARPSTLLACACMMLLLWACCTIKPLPGCGVLPQSTGHFFWKCSTVVCYIPFTSNVAVLCLCLHVSSRWCGCPFALLCCQNCAAEHALERSLCKHQPHSSDRCASIYRTRVVGVQASCAFVCKRAECRFAVLPELRRRACTRAIVVQASTALERSLCKHQPHSSGRCASIVCIRLQASRVSPWLASASILAFQLQPRAGCRFVVCLARCGCGCLFAASQHHNAMCELGVPDMFLLATRTRSLTNTSHATSSGPAVGPT
jgi:hypothetical protein